MDEKTAANCRVYACVNQKGGVGKSVSSTNLGVGLARHGQKVLIVDLDSQASQTVSLGWRQPDELPVTIATQLAKVVDNKPLDPRDGILHHDEGIDLMPSSIELSGLEMRMVNAMSREFVLKTYLAEIKQDYDAIILDCPPTLGMMTINALAAADRVIVLVPTDEDTSDTHETPAKTLTDEELTQRKADYLAELKRIGIEATVDVGRAGEVCVQIFGKSLIVAESLSHTHLKDWQHGRTMKFTFSCDGLAGFRAEIGTDALPDVSPDMSKMSGGYSAAEWQEIKHAVVANASPDPVDSTPAPINAADESAPVTNVPKDSHDSILLGEDGEPLDPETAPFDAIFAALEGETVTPDAGAAQGAAPVPIPFISGITVGERKKVAKGKYEQTISIKYRFIGDLLNNATEDNA